MSGRADKTSWRRCGAGVLAGGVLALTAACGGGGGGGSPAPAPAPPVGSAPVPPPAPPPPPAGTIGTVAWLQPALRLERDVFDTGSPAAMTASLGIQGRDLAYWFRYRHDASLADVSYSFRTADEGIDFGVRFRVFPERAPGLYADTLSVTLCADEACTRPVPGSPFELPLQLDVGYRARAEAGLTPWVPAQTAVLGHDVVAAAYSAVLDAVVTVSVQPQPVLRVHTLRDGAVRAIAMLTAPTSLSLAADGVRAAVGHDAAVSLVDLSAAAATPVRRLAVPLPVGAVVHGGARVLAFGAQRFNWNEVHAVDTASGAAARIDGVTLYGVPGLVLHPAGDRIYLADRGLSPDDVRRIELGAELGAATQQDSRYHGEHAFCGRLAASPDGQRLYTACGVVLATSATRADDMQYAGQLPLSPRDAVSFLSYRARALSVAPDNGSVALLEEAPVECDRSFEPPSDSCHTRVAVHDTGTLARRSLHGLPVHLRGDDRLRQWGRHLMHRSDGSLIVIAEVRTRGEATPTWLLHRGAL